MAIEVIKPGLSTSVQDLGRPGYYHLGIPESGGMDRYALRAANLLVGNREEDAVLEATFQGPELRFAEPALLAVTGADLEPRVAGKPEANWTSFVVRKGEALTFAFLKRGARAYIAVAGGIDVPLVLGSRSTYALGALGGLEGRPLRAADVLEVGQPTAKARPGRSVPTALRPGLFATTELRVLPGLYDFRVTKRALDGFFADHWRVATEADRIGYRFRGGRPMEFVPRTQPFGAGSDPSNIVDSCYPYGSIQIPGGSEPIVLHRDAVSGGGYFMIGTVISADMDRIGQMQPHAEARFVAVDMQVALA
ncbi:MAG: biotin-dependent carboxyltransferase family protein, partial [Acetobacteraceae bacterium]